MSNPRNRNRLVVIAVLVLLAAVVTVAVALSATRSKKSSNHAIDTAVVAALTTPPSLLSASDFTVDSKVSSASPLWGVFHVTPTSSAPASLGRSPVYGFVHRSFKGDDWFVVDYGSYSVGCSLDRSPGGGAPASIEAAAGYSCPPSLNPDIRRSIVNQERYRLRHRLNYWDVSIEDVALSNVDKSWVLWKADALGTHPVSIHAVYGFDHYADGAWTNAANGSAGVGCSSAPGSRSVPTAVRRGFGYACGDDTATVAALALYTSAVGTGIDPSQLSSTAELAAVRPGWAYFKVTPSASAAQTHGLSQLHGFAQKEMDGQWVIVDNGSFNVGCGKSGGRTPVTLPPLVRLNVLAEFGYRC